MKKITNWLMGFGINRVLKRINKLLEKAEKGGSLDDIKRDIKISLVIAEALDEYSTIAVNLLNDADGILADNKIDKDEAIKIRVAVIEATGNFKGLLKK